MGAQRLRITAVVLLVFCAALFVASPTRGAKSRKDKKQQQAQQQAQTAQVYFEEGLLFYKEGQLKRALERFQQSAQLEPQSPETHYMLGVSYFHLSELEKAEKSLKQALEVNPFFTDAHNILGAVYDQQGNVDQAIAEWNIVLSDQNFPQPWNATFNIGKAMETRGSWEEAVIYFKRTVDLNPSWFRAWFRLGLAQEELGALQEAKESYEKALEHIPQDSPFLYLLNFRMGLICYKLNMNVCAKEYFDEVCSSRPDTAEGKKACDFLEMLRNRPPSQQELPPSIYR